ncbi:hypothetical protein [Sutcliffiella cohnii]|uniref:hypothetical protein n=1 Tax=Sutcliffiella cohnii TaxID=33932 RepID=UPI002E1E35C8|nr:hypothetical protein [Sutcliffiella cohnii]
MRKRLLHGLVSVFLLTVVVACSSDAYPALMPEKNGEYSLLWLRDRNGGVTPFPLIFNEVNKVTMPSSLEETNKNYPELKLEKVPAFVIFDNRGVVFKTYDQDEAINFLEDILNDSK